LIESSIMMDERDRNHQTKNILDWILR